jgi:hypothetical protein
MLETLPELSHERALGARDQWREDLRMRAQQRYGRCKMVIQDQLQVWLGRMLAQPTFSKDFLITEIWDAMNIQVRTIVTEETDFREDAPRERAWIQTLEQRIDSIEQVIQRLTDSAILRPQSQVDLLKGTLVLILDQVKINLRLIRRKVMMIQP